MAVTQALVPFEGEILCLLFDAEADSIEVVHPDGFALEEDIFDFYPSFYDEQPVPTMWVSIMVRRLRDSDVPVGLRVDNISTRFRSRPWRRRVPTIPQLVEMMLIVAYQDLGEQPQSIPDLEAEPA